MLHRSILRNLRAGWAVPVAGALLACAAEGISGAPQHGPVALWQLPSQHCRAEQPTDCSQINSYVLRTTNGSLIVIDGGFIHDAKYLRAFIAARSNSPPRVHAWFVSHTHLDHVGALTKILEDNRQRPDEALQIDRIYGSILPVDTVAKYPWPPQSGQEEVRTLQAFLAALSGVNAEVTEVDTGQVIHIDDVTIEILGKKNPELTQNLVNNSSVVMRVSDGSKSILFTGDLGTYGGQKLLHTRFAGLLRSDYVQMAHHGQRGVDRDFYEMIGPKYCLWPTPRFVWAMPTTQGTLDWMRQLGVLHHFLQFDGLVGIDTMPPLPRATSST